MFYAIWYALGIFTGVVITSFKLRLKIMRSLKKFMEWIKYVLERKEKIAELEAENARLREDAERYEYLRNPHNETYFLYQKDGFGGAELMSGPSLDDAIDEARKP